MAITPGKNFQHVIYPIAQEKGYMREEGIDLKMLVIAGTPSIQGLLAGSIQFTVAGTSALIAAAKGAACEGPRATNSMSHLSPSASA